MPFQPPPAVGRSGMRHKIFIAGTCENRSGPLSQRASVFDASGLKLVSGRAGRCARAAADAPEFGAAGGVTDGMVMWQVGRRLGSLRGRRKIWEKLCVQRCYHLTRRNIPTCRGGPGKTYLEKNTKMWTRLRGAPAGRAAEHCTGSDSGN